MGELTIVANCSGILPVGKGQGCEVGVVITIVVPGGTTIGGFQDRTGFPEDIPIVVVMEINIGEGGSSGFTLQSLLTRVAVANWQRSSCSRSLPTSNCKTLLNKGFSLQSGPQFVRF